eukprot:GHUV01024747.1.p1 GENE.GHUV01024747.1~~GHUV01024747.1.p1  ORF type:complete len:159 (+),score=25.79 GHUV01024747.1:520-996(+)
MGSTKACNRISDGLAWALNVSTSVVIVFANKVLLDSKTGHGFKFATTLCGLHFMACASSIWLVQMLGLAKRAYIPWADVLRFAVVANISIASLNLSLLVNSVGFYQVSTDNACSPAAGTTRTAAADNATEQGRTDDMAPQYPQPQHTPQQRTEQQHRQ